MPAQRVERSGGRPVVRYRLTVDIGEVDGKRQQYRKRYKTEREARAALAEIPGDVAKGTYVHPSVRTVKQACDDWIAGKVAAGRKRSTIHGYEEKLSVVISELGDVLVQKLTKRQVDDLVTTLRAGGLKAPQRGVRKPWAPRSVNYLLGLFSSVLEVEMKQGHVVRNVVALVDHLPSDPKKADPLTEEEIDLVESYMEGDRLAIAWLLGLNGLRLGEAYQASGFVVVNEAGEALSPHALTGRWARMLKGAGVRHVRLQDARHTCGTMMHLKQVPIALIAAWLGHASKAFIGDVRTFEPHRARHGTGQLLTEAGRDTEGALALMSKCSKQYFEVAGAP